MAKLRQVGFFEIVVQKDTYSPRETWIYDGKAKKTDTDFSIEGSKSFAIQSARDLADDIASREIRGYEEAEIVCWWQRPTSEEEDENGFIPEDEEIASYRIDSHDGEEDEEGEPRRWEVIEG